MLQETNLWEFRLRETRLAHLGWLAHVDVALCQRTLGERLGTQILACLADTHVTSVRSAVWSWSSSAQVSHVSTGPLAATAGPSAYSAACLTFYTSTATWRTIWRTPVCIFVSNLHHSIMSSLHSPGVGPLTWPRYPGGGMGGITRLKGMGRFIAVSGLGPVPIIPIWSWVWKYILDVRPVVNRKNN